MFLPLGDNIQQRTIPIVPAILVALNVLVFAYETRLVIEAHGNPQVEIDFMNNWGLIPQQLAEGQIVGLMSHMFVHGGFGHLAGNMIVLWAFAGSLEAGLGSLCFLAFYILWGLVGGLAHACFDLGSEIPLVGASGAIAGLIGAYTVAYGADAKIRGLFFLFFRAFRVEIPATLFGVGWIGLQLWNASCDPEGIGGVAWYAHIGGFAAGALTLWLGRDFIEKHVAVDTDGTVLLLDKPLGPRPCDEIKPAREPMEDIPDNPDACPYCHADLSESETISTGLIRCANPACGRLVYHAEAVR